jgi:hypothetical protein
MLAELAELIVCASIRSETFKWIIRITKSHCRQAGFSKSYDRLRIHCCYFLFQQQYLTRSSEMHTNVSYRLLYLPERLHQRNLFEVS